MKMILASDFGFGGIDTPYDKAFMEEALREPCEAMRDADFRMLNLEKLFYGGSEPIMKSGPCIGLPSDAVHSLRLMGIDAVGLANNHTGDFGAENVLFNLKLLRENGIRYAGGGENIEEAYTPLVFEKDGERASVIAVCENEFGMADEGTPGAAGFDLFRLARLIKQEKSEGGYVIVSFHGGNEDNPYPSPKKRELYRYLTEIGADAVIAAHTHCPQGYEYYMGKPIVYSMGNFFFSPSNPTARGNPNDAWYYGYMSSLELSEGKISFTPIPYKYDKTRIEILKGERKKKFLCHLARLSAPIASGDEIKRLFRGWALITGPIYAGFLKYSKDIINDKELSRHIKNDFSCEAHNELLTTYINMCYDGITEDDEAARRELEELFVIDLERI